MTRALVIGAAGQVGEHLCRTLQKNGHTVFGTGLIHAAPEIIALDIRQSGEVDRIVQSARADVVYLPASLTHVDYCEQHPQESYQVNVVGVENVLKAVNKSGARLVYFSSDYIFDGEDGPYAEDAAANPINGYGRQKLIAEHLIALQARNFLIVRTTVVYGWENQGKNFIFRLLRSLQNGETVRVPVDQIGTPTFAPNLAEATVELADSPLQGVFHLVGTERVGRFEFACHAARVFGLDDRLIQPVQTSDLHQPARRPLKAGMTTLKAQGVLKTPLISYRDGLTEMVAEKETYLEGKSK